MPVNLLTGAPLGPVAMEIRGGTQAPPPDPPTTVTRPIFGSSQEDGATGFERLEDVILGRNLEARRVFWGNIADDPRPQLASDKAAGRLVIASHKAPNVLGMTPEARIALFETHRANVIAYGEQMVWILNHEPENDGISTDEFRARWMAYWRCMKGLNASDVQFRPAVTNAVLAICLMAVTEKSSGRQAWRDLIDPAGDPLPMDLLAVDGYNPLNRRSFSNIFTWWGQQAVALGIPWMVAETATHGTPEERSSWWAGMDTFVRKTDEASQSLRVVMNFDSHEGQNAGEIGWRMEDGFAPGWTIVNNRAVGTRVEDLLTPAQIKLHMDSYPPRTLLPGDEPEPPEVPELDAGPVPIGTASYPVPADAVFVSLGSPNTNLGTEASPVGSIARAATLAPNPGTIVLRGGVYNDVSDVRLPNKDLTIQNYPGEEVWLDGSDPITGWVIDPDNASRWRRTGWTTVLDRTVPTLTLTDPAYPAGPWPEQLWRNGVPYEQVDTLAKVTDPVTETGAAGRFFFDTATSRLYVAGLSPQAPNETRITVRQQCIQSDITNRPRTRLRGFGVRRYGTSQMQYGAVKLYGPNSEVENMHFVECSASALFAQTTTALSIQHCLFDGNGQMGARCYKVTYIDAGYNHITRNNRKRFSTMGAAGGFKFDTECHAGNMHHNLCEDNYGHQLWWDINSHYCALISNVVDGQLAPGAGCYQEYGGYGCSTAGNWVRACTHGILGSELAGNYYAANNTTVDCTNHVRVQKGDRDPANAAGFVIVNHLASDGHNAGNLLVSYRDSNEAMGYDAAEWHITNTRAWRKTPGASPYARVTMTDGDLDPFSTQADLAAATGEEAGSEYADNVATDPYLETDRKTPKAPCIGTGVPIRAEVADLLGWDDETRLAPNVGAY